LGNRFSQGSTLTVDVEDEEFAIRGSESRRENLPTKQPMTV